MLVFYACLFVYAIVLVCLNSLQLTCRTFLTATSNFFRTTVAQPAMLVFYACLFVYGIIMACCEHMLFVELEVDYKASRTFTGVCIALVGNECSCDVHLCSLHLRRRSFLVSARCARKSHVQYATPLLQTTLFELPAFYYSKRLLAQYGVRGLLLRGGWGECSCRVHSCPLLCCSLGDAPSALATFICVLCTLRTQSSRSMCDFTHCSLRGRHCALAALFARAAHTSRLAVADTTAARSVL
jgi:hypothetical protein